MNPMYASAITDDKIEHDLDEVITHQQQLHNTNSSLTTHQLTNSASTSEPSLPSVHIALTPVQTVFMKGKHPNATPQFLISRPQSS